MKILLIVIASVVLLVFAVVVIGLSLPKPHVVSRSASYRAKPERLFSKITGVPSFRIADDTGARDLDKRSIFARGYHSCDPQMINRALRSLRLSSFVATLIVATLASAQQGARATVALLRSHAAAEDFNGSVLVARDGRILYQHAFGHANREWKIPNDLQTKFKSDR